MLVACGDCGIAMRLDEEVAWRCDHRWKHVQPSLTEGLHRRSTKPERGKERRFCHLWNFTELRLQHPLVYLYVSPTYPPLASSSVPMGACMLGALPFKYLGHLACRPRTHPHPHAQVPRTSQTHGSHSFDLSFPLTQPFAPNLRVCDDTAR